MECSGIKAFAAIVHNTPVIYVIIDISVAEAVGYHKIDRSITPVKLVGGCGSHCINAEEQQPNDGQISH